MATQTQEQAEAELQRLKSYAPFRAWYAIEINGEWYNCDSMAKVKARMRKAGMTSATILAAQ